MILNNKKTVIVVLLIAVLTSAFAVIYTKFLNRKYFVELQKLYQERDALQIEWQKLRLERSTWMMHGRIETIATKQLGLIYPSPQDLVIIKQ